MTVGPYGGEELSQLVRVGNQHREALVRAGASAVFGDADLVGRRHRLCEGGQLHLKHGAVGLVLIGRNGSPSISMGMDGHHCVIVPPLHVPRLKDSAMVGQLYPGVDRYGRNCNQPLWEGSPVNDSPGPMSRRGDQGICATLVRPPSVTAARARWPRLVGRLRDVEERLAQVHL